MTKRTTTLEMVYVICGGCQQHAHEKHNRLIKHYDANREHCPYSGGTWADSLLHITTRARRIQRHIKRLAAHQNRPLTEKEYTTLENLNIYD